MKVIKPPQALRLLGKKSVFLAGSIDQGQAIDWQAKFEEELADLDVVILNPRRDYWDPTWDQSAENKEFRKQVTWEINGMKKAKVIAMNFCVDGLAPISLLELGLHARSGKVIVHCPLGYWRKGNVDLVCERYDLEQANSFEDLIIKVRKALS